MVVFAHLLCWKAILDDFAYVPILSWAFPPMSNLLQHNELASLNGRYDIGNRLTNLLCIMN